MMWVQPASFCPQSATHNPVPLFIPPPPTPSRQGRGNCPRTPPARSPHTPRKLPHTPAHPRTPLRGRRHPPMVVTMQAVIPYALLIALIATLAVLVVGIVGMMQGGEFNKRYGNKLMRWRVALQGISLVLFVLLMTWKGKGS